MKTQGKKILIGMSGGVDSSLSAALLKEAGYDLIGVYLKAWSTNLDQQFPGACPWKNDIADAKKVAARLGIPFTVIDIHQAYKKKVIDVLEAEYARGRTPNPDILCNREMKFGLLLELAQEMKYDSVATGHYARIQNLKTKIQKSEDSYQLLRGIDHKKDQTYFLWQLTKKDLPYILFPIGNLTKQEVRTEAKKRNLPVAEKADSQGICFLGPISIREFLSKRLVTKPGPIIDQTGKTVGIHQGAAIYTIGQREGLGVLGGNKTNFYVVSRDLNSNIVYVDQRPPASISLIAKSMNWLEGIPLKGQSMEARIRHGQQPQLCKVDEIGEGYVKIVFDMPQIAVAPGQSVVFSRHDLILGGGVIGS